MTGELHSRWQGAVALPCCTSGSAHASEPESQVTGGLLRRALLMGAFAAPAAIALRAVAQQADIASVAESLRADGEALLRDIASAPRGAELSRDQLNGFVSRDLFLRLEGLNGFAAFTEEQLHEHARIFNAGVAAQFDDVPITPREQAQIVPMTVPPPPAESNESLLVVLMDVILQSLGIYLGGALIRQILEADPELTADLEALVGAISSGDVSEVVALLDPVAQRIADGGLLASALKVVSPELVATLRRRLLGRLVLQFVPLAGQAYLAGCILLAIYNNWDRLMRAA